MIRNGLQWKDAPPGYGPYKTLYNRFIRWSRFGVFDRIVAALVEETGAPEWLMIDSTHLEAHRTAASLLKKMGAPRCIGRTRGGLKSKLHAVCDEQGRPIVMMLTEGQMNDHRGGALCSLCCLRRAPCSAIVDTAATGFWKGCATVASSPHSADQKPQGVPGLR